jgi:putative transcriptional regulator
MKNDHELGDPAELAALYAAGALPRAERAAYEAHLDTCAVCRVELRSHAPAVAALANALAPVEPDPALRKALLRRVAPSSAGHSPLRSSFQTAPARAEAGAGLLIQRAAEGAWEDASVPGIRVRVLFVDRPNNHFTALVRMEPGTSYPRHRHDGPEECLVLEGDLHVGDEVLNVGDYQRASVGSTHGLQSTKTGCLLLITSSLTDEFV